MILQINIIKAISNKKIRIVTNMIKKISSKYNMYKFYKNKSYIIDIRKELNFNDIIVCNKNKYYAIVKLLKIKDDVNN